MKYNNYTVVSPDNITEIKNKIITRFDLTFLSYPEFGSIEEDEKQVELFAQEQENPPIYTGEMKPIKVDLGEYNWDCYDYMEFHVQLLKNYVKNVGGEIIEIKTENFRYRNRRGIRHSTSKAVYMTIPKDAPYCTTLQKTFKDFRHEEHRLIARHYLRHIEHKNLPDNRKEWRYIRDIWYSEENPYKVQLISLAVAVISCISAILWFLTMLKK